MSDAWRSFRNHLSGDIEKAGDAASDISRQAGSNPARDAALTFRDKDEELATTVSATGKVEHEPLTAAPEAPTTEPRFSDEEFIALIDPDRSQRNTRLLTDDETKALRGVPPDERRLEDIQYLPQPDAEIIGRYTGADHLSLNTALAEGTVTDGQIARADALRSALSKLPDYHGIVYRYTNLRPEVLARYQQDAIVTETRFTSATADKKVSFPGQVEFRIISKNGKYIAPYSHEPQEHEVLFQSGDRFKVIHRDYSKQDRTVIHMVQI